MSPALPLSAVELVRVGSRNGPKIEAVRAAIAPYAASSLRVDGVEVASGVPEQPVGYPEIARGARNRARLAFEACGSDGPCDLAVGIEDGLVELGELGGAPERETEVLNVGCAVVTDGRRESVGFSSAFAYPPECTLPALRDRAPIGDLFDRLFERYEGGTGGGTPSGRGIGNVGRLTLGVLPRSDYARHAVLCALVRFLHPSLYFPAPPDAPGAGSPEAEGASS